MTNPYYADPHLTLYGGDCREVLRELPAESVHCVVTSPPYWGLRDYGTATWDGGDPACDHLRPVQPRNDRPKGDFHGGSDEGDYAREPNYRDTCRKCGARRIDSQLGLEPTPEEYVANMVAVFREVRRVLRADGTLWLNLGDSYATGGDRSTGRNDTDRETPGGRGGSFRGGVRRATEQRDGLKPKDLVGIPWRVAFAIQADGWYLRSDIIWSKPNPMPESVTDRPTKAHEYLFLLSKAPRYYYDGDAVREASDPQSVEWNKYRNARQDDSPYATHGSNRDEGRIATAAGRNLRSVWTIATEPYPGAHFATFPRKLVEPCVKAGTSERGVCPECGAGWTRVLDRRPNPSRHAFDADSRGWANTHSRTGNAQSSKSMHRNGSDVQGPPPVTVGWARACRCGLSEGTLVPATVIDPFAGSGTTLLVAQALGRRGVGIDLNPEYLRQALDRNRQAPLGLVG